MFSLSVTPSLSTKSKQCTDGQTLPTNRRQRAYNNGTLVIEQLQRLEDAGTYTCMAQNKQKQTARRNVEIQVLGKCETLVAGYLILTKMGSGYA